MKWVELTSPQLGDLPRSTICVLPLGATEQHGPHLPVGTDQMIADGIAARLDQSCEDRLLIFPSLPATCSTHHMAFPGSLTLEHEAFTSVIIQLIQSAAHHGFRRFFLLNAHGGNMSVLGVIVERLSSLLSDVEVVAGTWFRMASVQLRPLVEGDYPAVGHACEFETSLIMALRPELVVETAIADGGEAPASELLRFDLLTGGPTVRSLPFERITANGVWGKPSYASAEKGRNIMDVIIPVIRDLMQAHWPDAPGVSRDGVSDGVRRP